MNMLFRIVYAAHAKGTHHKLALDALRHISCMDADLWQRLFLRHAKLYVDGSKAPDDEFKDFKNHVLHVRDGLWGGAPEKVRSWYHHFVEALAQQDWPTAVYCAGVLSHYYTDPLHPFHTAQSEAENNIHRAAEWSISKAYDELRAEGERDFGDMKVVLPEGPNWLAQLVVDGAQMANASYEKLIAHYDLQRGVADPPAGLDRVARRLVAELIRYATLSYAAVLDRALEEANVHAPEVSLTGPMLLAAAGVPFNMLGRRIADAQERRLIEAMYDELQATGTVQQNLPEDDRAVRDLHAAEVLAKLPPAPAVSKVFPFKPREPVVTRIDQRREALAGTETAAVDNVVPLRASPRKGSDAPAPAVAAAAEAPAAPAAEPVRLKAGLTDRLERVVVKPALVREVKKPAESGDPRFHLTLDHDVVDGPSIGPKTAEKLYPHGIRTVRDLIKADPAALSVLVDTRHITPETISGWQDQARLVCTVPGLRGTHAQLLVGSGYHTAEAIADAEADQLCADVLRFATSVAGQRLLRNGEPPDIEKIKGWLEAARSTKAA